MYTQGLDQKGKEGSGPQPVESLDRAQFAARVLRDRRERGVLQDLDLVAHGRGVGALAQHDGERDPRQVLVDRPDGHGGPVDDDALDGLGRLGLWLGGRATEHEEVATACHGEEQSLSLVLPPLSALVLEREPGG